jgi:hypothetical protein
MKLVSACLGALLIAAPLTAQTAALTSASTSPDFGTRAQESIQRELARRAQREVSPAVLAAAAQRAVDRMTPGQVRDLAEHGGAGAVVDALLAAAAEQRNIAAADLGNPFSDLLFVPLAPCRIFDTRQISNGLLAPGQRRDFLVAGTNAFLSQGGNGGGCGVPDGTTEPQAAAVVLNFVAVSPQGAGHIVAWQYGQQEPLASILNYAGLPLNIANGILIPIDGTTSQPFDLSVRAAVSPTHLLADVTGYYTRFPVEAFAQPQKDRISVGQQTAAVSLSDGLCHRLTTCDVTSPTGVNGTVLIKSWAQVSIDHTTGTHDRVIVGAKQFAATVNCTPVEDQVANMDFEVSDTWPSEPNWEVTIANGRTFPQNGGVTRTYELMSRMIVGSSSGDEISSARMVCLFIPD